MIDEQESSGLSASAFCERQGVRRNLFYRWRSRLASMPQENSTALLDVSALFGTAERGWDVELELGDGLVLRHSARLMFFPEGQVKVWLCTTPTDMRKSFDGLSGLVKHQLEEDPLSGQLFVFINRRKTQMKVLYFDRSGYCIWSKRLVQGQFNYPSSAAGKSELTWWQLKLLLEGIEAKRVRHFKRFARS